MRDGKIVEEGLIDEVMRHPQSDYTRLLIDSAPSFAGRQTNT